MTDIDKNPNRHAKSKTLPTSKHRPSMRGRSEDEFAEHKLAPLTPQPSELGEEAEVEAKRKEEMAKLRADSELAGMVALHMKSTLAEVLDWALAIVDSKGEAIKLTQEVLAGISQRRADEKAVAEMRQVARAHEANMSTLRPRRTLPKGGGNCAPGASTGYPAPGQSRSAKHEGIPLGRETSEH